MIVDDTSGSDQLLYSVFEQPSNTALRIVDMTAESYAGTMTSGDINTDSGYPLPTELRTKEFDFGDPMLDKLLDAVELDVFVDRDTSLAFTMLGDGGENRRDAASVVLPARGFRLDIDALDSPARLISRPFQTLAVYPPNGERFRSRAIQGVLSGSGAAHELRSLGLRIRPIGRRPVL